MSLFQYEGISTKLLRQESNSTLGLYCIQNEKNGERSFSYWRDSSPVRKLFDLPIKIDSVPDILYFSGISLAVMRKGINNLVLFIEQLSASECLVVFDPNYRPSLWQDNNEAQTFYRQVLPLCDWVLPTLDDEKLLWGISGIEECRCFYRQFNLNELIVKAPRQWCYAFSETEQHSLQAEEVRATDTTGAGDSFNAGYITARVSGASMRESILAAQELARQVVQHQGAILPLNNT